MLERLKITILCLSTLVVAYGLIGGLLERVSAGDEAYDDLSVFTKVLNRVRSDYVENPDMRKAMRGALHGMMEALDPYSSFIEPNVYKELKADPENDSGLGLSVSKRYGYIYVVSVALESPAYLAGIRSLDLFESINQEPTTLMSLWEAERHLSGDSAEEVKLRVIRSRHSEPLEITLKASDWETPSISAKVIEGNLGLIQIPSIEKGAAEVVQSKLKLLFSNPLEGLLIDLRRSTSGDLEEAVALADLFLPKGKKIITEKQKSGAEVERVSMSDSSIADVPIVLLVNGGTSGAAEVLAAALRDNEVAKVVGERTNGKGSLQKEYVLDDGSVLILTNTLLIRPNGQPLQKEELRESGIDPDALAPTREFVTDYYFENSPEDDQELGPEFYLGLDEAIDAQQMEKAVQYLKELLNEESSSQKVA